MEPEKSPGPSQASDTNNKPILTLVPAALTPPEMLERGLRWAMRALRWIFTGPKGLRAGWSVILFFLFFAPLNIVIDAGLYHFHLIDKHPEFSPQVVFFGELGGLLALVVAVALVGLVERRRILDYNLRGSRRPQHFFSGLVSGFVALSALAGGLAARGWLHIGHGALSGLEVLKFAVLWGCVFLVGACLEEGMFRCYGLFTLTRGINFWWAFGILAVTCGYQAVFVRGTASWGVYAAALLGLIPCCILHQRNAPSSGFWCATWVTSTLFGFVHVSNSGEAWIGIFSAAFIGFVFCVSIRITGSAWWAIGCHAAWDWAETYFYGTADSGLKPHGSFLTSIPAGNPLWSGGAVGPEGSLLVLGVILLLLAVLLLYGRLSAREQSAPATLTAAD